LWFEMPSRVSCRADRGPAFRRIVQECLRSRSELRLQQPWPLFGVATDLPKHCSGLRSNFSMHLEQTALSGIMRLVAAAQASGSHRQDLADRAAAILPAPTPSDSQNQMSRSRTRPKQLWPFCGQSSHELPLMATISCFLERILRVSKRKRTVYFSVSYRTAALAAESRLSDSQSSNPGSIPGSATRQSEVRRNLPAFP